MKFLKSGGSIDRGPKLLMALHGNGDSAGVAEPYWLGCLRQGYDLAPPQSSQVTLWGGYTWIDLDKGIAELAVHLESVRSTGIEPKDMVIEGFSDGRGWHYTRS